MMVISAHESSQKRTQKGWPVGVRMLHSGVIEKPMCFNFVADVVERWGAERPEATGLWWVDAATGREEKYSFRDLARKGRQAANSFRAAGVRAGDRVLIMMPRLPQWWLAMLGLIRLGAVPVPSTTLLTPRELNYRLTTAQVSAVVTDSKGALKLDGFEGQRFVVGGGYSGWIDWDRTMQNASAEFSGEPTLSDDPGIIYFTSATTGEPKMVLHTQASYGLAHQLTAKLWLDLQPTDVHWNLSDLGWAKAAWSSFYSPWFVGACVFALDTRGRFDPQLTLQTLAEFPITTWCAPPTAMRLIVRQELARWKFPHLRHCVSAGEPVNPEIVSAWKAATGLTVYEAYGQTETVVLIGNYRCLGYPVRPGSMGKVTPDFEVGVFDEDQRPVPAGQEGELAVRVSPRRPLGLFREYWQNPEENARQFRGDWYFTGDRATRDPEGYFWFVGRNDDVIKSAGYRIGPFEVENALMEHPAVLEVAAVGKADEVRGQIVKAFVVLRPGVAASEDLKHALQQHCKRVAAPYKYPREVEFTPELPKTISGKTRRVELRARA